MFQYRLFFMFLDLAELPTLFDVHPLWSYLTNDSISPVFAVEIISVTRRFRWIRRCVTWLKISWGADRRARFAC
jgi:hypothetical protein